MKKLLALLLVPLFLTPTVTISTDLAVEFEADDLLPISHGVAERLSYYTTIPDNPVLRDDTTLYHEADLNTIHSVVPQTENIKISSLTLNGQGIPVFQLANGAFIEASRLLIADDVVLEESPLHMTMWTLKGVQTYEHPFVKGVGLAKKQLAPFENVQISRKAVTASGTYFKIEDYGWVSEVFLTDRDQRMAKVQDLLTRQYQKDNLSIYVKSLVGGEVAEINADQSVYAASVAKLPILYYAQKQLDKGKYTLTQSFTYTDAVLAFDGAYDTEGSGSLSKIADNKDYSVEHLLKAIAQESDNAASNIAAYYLTNQFDKEFNKQIRQIAGQSWDMVSREATVRMAGQVMEAIYHQDGVIIDYLAQTSFDKERIAKDIPVRVAHKIGDAYDFRHDVAIVYADQPFILAIFTEHMTYDEITAIANAIYTILK